jgi:hypothetical protein
MLTRVTERTRTPFAGTRVNRDAGTIAGVLICGFESANGRDYPASVFRRDFKAYEGAPVNCDHARDATVDRRIGWFTDVAPGDDGRPRGVLNVLKEHPMAARVFEAAERNPALFGFSHVAMCETKRGRDGREVVEAIKSVESIDLVASPATTKGLFESKGTAVKISLKQYAERRGPALGPDTWGAIVKLCREMGDDFADAPVMDEPPADAPADGDLKTALMSALAPMLDEAFDSGDVSKLVSALKDFVKLHAKHTGGDAPKDEPKEEAPEKDKEESRPTMAGVLAECKAAGLESPSVEFVAALMETPSAAARLPFIKLAREAKAPPRETPKAGGRAPGAGETGTRTTEKSVPTDGKAFAESVR